MGSGFLARASFDASSAVLKYDRISHVTQKTV